MSKIISIVMCLFWKGKRKVFLEIMGIIYREDNLVNNYRKIGGETY